MIIILITAGGCLNGTEEGKNEASPVISTSDGSASIQLQETYLPEGVSLDDISIQEFTSDEYTINGTEELTGYRLEPDGLILDNPVNLSISIDYNTSGDNPLPQLFHASGNEIKLMNDVKYVYTAGGLDIKAPIKHFSAVYINKRRVKNVGVKDPKHFKGQTEFYQFRTPYSGVKAKVGDTFTIKAELQKKNTIVRMASKIGQDRTYMIVPGTETIWGRFFTKGNVISPTQVKDKPEQKKFTDEFQYMAHEFKCEKAGEATLYYVGFLSWELKERWGDGEFFDKGKYNTMFYFSWQINCIENISCAQNTFDKKTLVPQQKCINDCKPTEYCSIPLCQCLSKIEVSCANKYESIELFDAYKYTCKDDCDQEKEYCSTRECQCIKKYEVSCAGGQTFYKDTQICKDDCAQGTKCNRVTCKCEDRIPTYSCMNRTNGEYAPLEGQYTCIDDCEPDLYCTQDTCQCEKCTPDPFEYGEIVVVDKSGYADWEVAADGYAAGYLMVEYRLKHMNPKASASGIAVNYKVSGPESGAAWQQVDDEGVARITHWIGTKGTYTIEIVDFDTFGAYCGDGDKITIEVK